MVGSDGAVQPDTGTVTGWVDFSVLMVAGRVPDTRRQAAFWYQAHHLPPFNIEPSTLAPRPTTMSWFSNKTTARGCMPFNLILENEGLEIFTQKLPILIVPAHMFIIVEVILL